MSPTSSRPSPTVPRMPLWLPWVAAPMFMLLPIVGCGAAASLRRHDVATEEYRPAGAARSVVAITRPAR